VPQTTGDTDTVTALELDPRALRDNNPNFEAKMSFAERCSILALFRKGVSVRMLAAAFGVNRRTVTHITNPESTRYKAVRDREKAMGTEEFIAEYYTEAAVRKINDAAGKPELNQATSEYDANAGDRLTSASKRATGNAGINTVKLAHHEFSHRIEVAWLEANTAEDDDGPFEHPAGWYWRDLDGEQADRWQGDPDTGTHTTSAKAFNHAKVTL
jgi:DNA invertase Pin-like site-specific DNA recombinase